MDPITGIGVGLNAWNSFQAGNAARKAQQLARQQEQQALNLQERSFADRFQLYRDLEARGAYDTQAMEKLVNEANRLAAETTTRNIAGQARTLGYRVGDTAPLERLRIANQALQNKAASDLMNVKQDAWTRQVRDMNALNDPSQLSNSMLQLANRDLQLGRQDEQNTGIGNVLAGALMNDEFSSWLGGRLGMKNQSKNAWNSFGTTMNPEQVWNMSGMSGFNDPNRWK